MRRAALIVGLTAALMVAASPVSAIVHEITGMTCSIPGEVEPPGQEPPSLTALQATGVIESIVGEFGVTNVTITFDFDKPSSKFISSGGVVVIPNFPSAGLSLTLTPGAPVPDPAFAAHANCKNLN